MAAAVYSRAHRERPRLPACVRTAQGLKTGRTSRSTRTTARLGRRRLSMRKDYNIAMNFTEMAVDDPDVAFYENYVCGAARNYIDYRNAEVDKLIDKQSAGA